MDSEDNASHLHKFGEYLHAILNKSILEGIVPESFRHILDRLIEHIKEENDNNDDNYGLSDFTTVFKPGLFTSAVFEQYPLILKDLPNLTPAVFERFNQLNSNNPSLTLNEDICNTFTSSINRNINHFTDNFRIISLSSADSVRNLSEAALSRITLISCTGYSDTERIDAIATISLSINQQLKPATYLESFSEKYFSEFDRNLSFTYLTKILKIVHLFDSEKELNVEEKLSIAIFRSICGSFKDDSNKIKVLKILDEVFEKETNKNFKALVDNTYKEKSPFYQKMANNSNKMFSDISNLSIICNESTVNDSNISFVNPFVDMIDAIFTGLSIHYPVILEGISGKGKHTAIQYVADILGYKVVTFGISSATTAEDLFCKTIPTRKNGKLEFVFTPSQILNLINSDSSDAKTIIILEEINQASPALLDSIAPLFDSSKNTILLPNGDIIQKGSYNIIALYDPSSQATIGSSLPLSFRINSIYHSVPHYSIEQINKIALKIFDNEAKFTNDHESFMNYFHIMSRFTPKYSVPELYTLNDIKKYKLFTDGPLKELESSIVENMILLYKYSEKEDIDDAIKLLKIDITELWPKFYIENDQFCACLSSNKIKTMSIGINKRHIQKSKKDCQYINSLTLLQRNCLLFLMCSVISKQTAIISGPTASGKSYIIRYFAKLLGKNMITIQVNNDTGISTLTGQFAPSVSLSSEDINDISKCLVTLCSINDLKKEINKILKIKDYKTWNPLKLKLIEDLVLSSKHKDKFMNEINILRSKRSFLSHLKQEDSAFIKAMQKGYWFLIDGIEAAPKELFEKIISLCSSNPILNLYERGPEYVYSRDAEGEFKIHDDFRLFITYNPNDIEPSRRLSPSILNKFVIFVLQPIDISPIMSGIVLHGLINNRIDEDLSIQISSRLANVHESAKNYSYNDPKQFAAFNKFTGRSLLFNINIINYYLKNTSTNSIAQIMNKCIKLNYCNSHKDPKMFYNKLLDELLKEPKLELIQAMKKDVDSSNEKYKNILIDLYELQTNKSSSLFQLKSFFNKIFQFELCDIDQLLFHIVDTLNQMKTTELINKFGSLSILTQFINQLYKNSQKPEIKSGELKSKLDDKVLFKNRLTTHSISQMHFIHYFIENDLLIDFTPHCFYSYSSRNIINEIANNLIDVNFNKLLKIVSKILQTSSIYDEAITLLNCDIIRQSKFSKVLKLVPLFIQLQQNQIPFSINHQDFLVTFVECDYSIEFSINDSNFELNDNSKILYKLNKVKIDTSKFYSTIFYVIDCLKNKKEPDFESKILIVDYPQISKNNHPLFSLYPNSNESRILKLFKTALLLDKPVNVNLAVLFGQFETDLIKLFNTLWNIVLPKEYKSAINVIGIFLDIEKESPNVFFIMNNELNSLKNTKSDMKLISDEIVKVIDLLKSIKMQFNQMRDDFKGLEPNSILQNLLEKWISDLENKKTEIQFDKLNEEYRKEANEIKEQKNILLKKLYDAKITSSNENKRILNQFIQYLEKMDITPTTFEFLKQTISQTKLNIERILTIIKNSETIEKIGNIPFPIKENAFIVGENIHEKICNIYLNYSETIKLLNNILNNRDPMSSLYELSHKDDIEIDELSQFLCSRSNDSDESEKEILINKVKNYAGALTIQQLFSLKEVGYELLLNPEKLQYEFEKFINRNQWDEHLEYWAGKMSLIYDPKDLIIIPKYTPLNIHPLFINDHTDSNPLFSTNIKKPGILLKETIHPSIELINELSKLEVSSYKNLVEYLNAVTKIALKVLRNKNVDIDFYEEIMAENNRIENEVFSIIIQLYPICKSQDSRIPFKFSFEDTFFIMSDWLNEKELCAKYPSLTYWLINNPECQRKLRFYLIDIEVKDDSLPLFLHILRIFSSMKSITFQTASQSEMAKKLSKMIIDYLIPKLRNNELQVMSWLNLLLPNTPIEFYDSEVALIHDFIKSLAQNPNTMKSNICKQCQEELFETIIKQIIDSIFNNRIHQYFTDELNDQFSEFIKNPHDSILEKINEVFTKEKRESFNEMKKDLPSISAALKNIRDVKNPLIKAIQEDKDKAVEIKLAEEKNKRLNIHDGKFNEFQSNVSTYQGVYEKIINNVLDDNNTICSNDLKKMHSSYLYFDKKGYKVFDTSYEIYIHAVKNQGFSKNIYSDCLDYFYIPPKLYDVKKKDSFKLKDDNVKKYLEKFNKKVSKNDIDVLTFNPLIAESIEEKKKDFEAERKHIIEAVSSSTLNKDEFAPKMHFDIYSKITEKTYPLTIQAIFSKCNTFLSRLDTERIYKNLFQDFQDIINEILAEIDKIKDIKMPKFNEFKNMRAEATLDIIMKIINPNIQTLDHFFTKFKKIVKDIVEKEKEINKDFETSLYSNEFTLPMIEIKGEKKADIYPGSFDKINQSNLATPFISLTPSNQIICCIDQFNPVIGPIIPDLYENRQISIKILSFIPHEIHSQIEIKKDDSIFSTIPISQSYNPITISLTIPKFNNNISKEITYSGNLQITSKDLVPLKLPCNFTLQFLPLNVLIHSSIFPLCFTDKVFKICCDKITPNEEIKIQLKIPHYDQNYNFIISKKSFANNQSEEPFCSIKENNILTIKMPGKSAYIHGIITVNIIPNVVVPFEINAQIIRNQVYFKIYDHFKKEFIDKILYVYIKPNTKVKYYCYIDANFAINRSDIRFISTKSINYNVQFGEIKTNENSLLYFDMDIEMNSNINTFDKIIVSIQTNGIEKNIDIVFFKTDMQVTKIYKSYDFISPEYSFTSSIIPHHAFNYKKKIV